MALPRFHLALLLIVLSLPRPSFAAPKVNAAALKFFEERVRPVLADNCRQCHGPSKQRGGLRLDSRQALLRGGDSGPAVVPGKPAESLLVRAIRQSGPLKMPPKATLSTRAIADLETWVGMGAPWPETQTAISEITKKSDFWAFKAPVRPVLPVVRETNRARSPIDHFVLAGLEARGLRPAPEADRRALVRRVTFDLTGLPPTPAEVDAFLADRRPDAYERVVERLLASPAYGERWGRHWLDVARYADSNGMDENLAQASAWRYRDYVIASFNVDKPYDRFIQEQIAGDLLGTANDAERHAHLIATGFLSLGPKMLAEDDPVKMEMDIIDEQIDTIGRTFLGLTLGCARCHDHKFDPFSMADYYGLGGIFKSTRTMEHFRVVARWQERPLWTDDLRRRVNEHDARITRLTADIDRTAREAAAKVGGARQGKQASPMEASFSPEARDKLQKLRAELAVLEKAKPVVPTAMAVGEGNPTNLKIHLRGSHLTLGREVPRRFPAVLTAEKEPTVGGKQSGRLELARWLTRPDHPLTARVLVNRVWHWHLGQGIVRSTDNFGSLGEMPINQPLLDWLAVEFVRSGWSIKALHRLIVLSSTYRMSSAYDADTARVDPENRLLWRWPRRRLEAEAVRDAIIAVCGRLDRSMGGTLLKSKNFEYVASTFSVNTANYASERRSVYLPVVRSALYEPLQAFDFADPSTATGERAVTTVASQALFLMNGELVREQTRHFAADLLARDDPDDGGRVHLAYERALGRSPTQSETARALDFVARLESQWRSEKVGNPAEQRLRAWQGLCRVLVSSNEFLYVE